MVMVVVWLRARVQQRSSAAAQQLPYVSPPHADPSRASLTLGNRLDAPHAGLVGVEHELDERLHPHLLLKGIAVVLRMGD